MENSLFLKRHKSGAKNCIQDKRVYATTIWSGHMIDKLKNTRFKIIFKAADAFKALQEAMLMGLEIDSNEDDEENVIEPDVVELEDQTA